MTHEKEPVSADATEELEVATDIATKLAAVILREGYGGIDHILELLDEDASFETAATYLAYLASIENTSKWGIGEILYFLRHRYSYVTIKVLDYIDGEPFPEELCTFLWERFSVDLRDALANKQVPTGGFLGWVAYKFDQFWLLTGKGEIRVWSKVKDEIRDDEWADTMAGQLSPIVSKLNARTAWAYYAVVARLPDRNERVDELSWTYYYELGNLKGNDIGASVRGDERHAAIRELMLPQVQEDMEDGAATVPNVRNRIAQKNREKQGFVFKFPPIEKLFVTDPHTGQSFAALHISDAQFQAYILFNTKLATRDLPPRLAVEYDDEDGIIYVEGSEVGYVTNRDEPAVQLALDHLVNRLRWSIRE